MDINQLTIAQKKNKSHYTTSPRLRGTDDIHEKFTVTKIAKHRFCMIKPPKS